MSRQVLITGATGMLGRQLMATAPKDYSVMGWSHSDIRPGLDAVDAVSATQVDGFFAEHSLDVCIHTVAWPDVQKCENDEEGAYLVNSVTTENIAAACRRHGVRLIHMSTEYVFDGTLEAGYSEDAEPNPLQTYGRTKLVAERRAVAVPEHLIVRLPVLYGEVAQNLKPLWVPTLLTTLTRGSTVKLDDRFERQPTWAYDVAQTLWHLVETDVRGVIHVASQEGMTKYAWGLLLASAAGLDLSGIEPDRGTPFVSGIPKPLRPWLLTRRLEQTGVPPLPGLSHRAQAYLNSVPAGTALGSLSSFVE